MDLADIYAHHTLVPADFVYAYALQSVAFDSDSGNLGSDTMKYPPDATDVTKAQVNQKAREIYERCCRK